MTAQKLRIGYRNVVVEHPNVEVSGAASGYPAVNATSWRYDERWRAPWTGNDLADLGLNWDVQTWTNGTSSAPDDWTLTGASATVARSSLHVFVDPYSALVTRVGTDCTFELDLDAYVASYRKQQVTFGLHVYSTSTNGRVYITDDTGTTTQAHGGAGVCNDFPLAFYYAQARTLRFADGPDEVHRNSIAKIELGRHAA